MIGVLKGYARSRDYGSVDVRLHVLKRQDACGFLTNSTRVCGSKSRMIVV